MAIVDLTFTSLRFLYIIFRKPQFWAQQHGPSHLNVDQPFRLGKDRISLDTIFTDTSSITAVLRFAVIIAELVMIRRSVW